MRVACFASWKELGAGHAHVSVPSACQERLWEGNKASLMQRHIKHAHPSFPPDLHYLCVFPLTLQPGGWSRKKALGWERLCAGFMVGARWVSWALGRVGGSIRPVGAALHHAQEDLHIATAHSLLGELLQSPQWPKIKRCGRSLDGWPIAD